MAHKKFLEVNLQKIKSMPSVMNDARDHYLKTLISIEQNTCDANFVHTFRGPGQLMRLILDMSDPEHTNKRSESI
jgi:hypothetical protein